MNDTLPRTSNFGKWMALTAALLGWLFDGLEMGLFPLIQKSALDELVGPDKRTLWMGIMTSFFLVGAATGGVLFGWLGDRIGRVRSMMLSVLTYAIVSGLCGFATDAWQIGVLRFIAALGMGGEWSLGVALINEIWPDRSRAFLAGGPHRGGGQCRLPHHRRRRRRHPAQHPARSPRLGRGPSFRGLGRSPDQRAKPGLALSHDARRRAGPAHIPHSLVRA